MTKPCHLRYATCAALVSAAAGLGAWPLVSPFGPAVIGWAAAGWLATTTIGIAGGSWVVACHGGTGPGFIVAVGVCMLARVCALGIGAFAAAGSDSAAVVGYLGGLLLGWLAPQTAEVLWLMRGVRRS